MFGKRNVQISNEKRVTPIRNTDDMYWVEAVAWVPVVYAVTIPAPSPEAACRLADDMVRQAPEIGVPQYAGRAGLYVNKLRVMPSGEPSRPVPVPESFGPKR